MFDDPMGLFDFESRGASGTGRQLSPEERRAWKTMRMEPVNDLDQVKAQYKQLAKEHHPDMNGGDAGAEERLKEINLAYDLIRKSLQSKCRTNHFLRCAPNPGVFWRQVHHAQRTNHDEDERPSAGRPRHTRSMSVPYSGLMST